MADKLETTDKSRDWLKEAETDCDRPRLAVDGL